MPYNAIRHRGSIHRGEARVVVVGGRKEGQALQRRRNSGSCVARRRKGSNPWRESGQDIANIRSLVLSNPRRYMLIYNARVYSSEREKPPIRKNVLTGLRVNHPLSSNSNIRDYFSLLHLFKLRSSILSRNETFTRIMYITIYSTFLRLVSRLAVEW